MKTVGVLRGCYVSRGSLFHWRTGLTRPQRPKVTSAMPSAGRGGKAPCLGNYAPPPASRGCGATKAGAKRRGSCSHRSTTVSPRASGRSMSTPQRSYLTLCSNACGRGFARPGIVAESARHSLHLRGGGDRGQPIVRDDGRAFSLSRVSSCRPQAA